MDQVVSPGPRVYPALIAGDRLQSNNSGRIVQFMFRHRVGSDCRRRAHIRVARQCFSESKVSRAGAGRGRIALDWPSCPDPDARWIKPRTENDFRVR